MTPVPGGLAVVDGAFSLASLALAAALIVSRRRHWWARLLALGMLGVAVGCNVSAWSVGTALRDAVGGYAASGAGALLQGATFAAFLIALLEFPTATERTEHATPLGRQALLAAGEVGLATLAAAVLSPAVSCVLLFGFALPATGLFSLWPRADDTLTAQERRQRRLLFSVLVAAAAIAVLLALVALVVGVVVTGLASTGLPRLDPAAGHGDPGVLWDSRLLFWFARAVPVAVAGCALAVTRLPELPALERRLGHALVATLVATQLGGLFVVVHAIVGQLSDTGPTTGWAATAVAAVLAALAFPPLSLQVERWVDRLLYGVRPAPYSVLAEIGSQSPSRAGDTPDLSRVAEAVGHGLGAQVCRLTVYRQGLGERTYAWSRTTVNDAEALVEVPIRLGEEQVGALSVDRAAVAGAQGNREHLIEDVADSLGAVLQASRLGVELERQLRAVHAHAAEIVASRRRIVAEMDAERRRIERDLHDGAQHHLVSLRLSLGLVEHLVNTKQLRLARTSLDEITEKIDVAQALLAQTAAGASPVLAQHGLVAALAKELGEGPPAVVLDVDGVDPHRRFPDDVEATVWFCCLEAVNNARKHAPGATVTLTLRAGGDRLSFTVRDDGPGWDSSRAEGLPGRGIRNVTARASAAGGQVVVRSAPGAGTTIDGWLPLPPGPDRPEAPAAPGVRTAPDLRDGPDGPDAGALVNEVRDVLRAADTLYGEAAGAERVRELTESLDQPLRVGVLAAAGADPSILVQLITRLAQREPGRLTVDVGDAGSDVWVVQVQPTGPDAVARPEALPDAGDPFRRARTVGVLIWTDEAGDLGDRDGRPQASAAAMREATARCARHAGDLCRDVVPVVGRLARTAITPDELRRSGLQRLQEVVDRRFVRRAPAFKAWSVLAALETLVRAQPPPDGAQSLLHRLERTRSSAHDLVEIDAVDALRSGEFDLSADDVEVAARLLGERGADPRTRLGLDAGADPHEVAAAAAAALTLWRRRATHPAATRGLRALSDAVVQSCEQMLGLTPPGHASAGTRP